MHLYGNAPENVEIKSTGAVPVYLPDRTVIGRGTIEGDKIHIELDPGTPLAEMMSQQLVGFSVVYLDSRARDIADKSNKE